MRSCLPLVLALLAGAGSPLHPQASPGPVARGDEAWHERSAGRDGDRADPAPIAAAIAAYREALEARPDDLGAGWRLLRALYFQSEYVLSERQARLAVLAPAKDLAERCLDRLAARAGVAREEVERTPETPPDALRAIPEAAPLYFWAAVDWGLWGQATGKLAAARQGVAGKLRTYARLVTALDEGYEAGGGHRLLGRLHSEAPKIPFFTGWVDRETALRELRRALEIDPGDPFNRLYLAEAILDHRRGRRSEAIGLLRSLAVMKPAGGKAVEQARVAAEAAARLAREGFPVPAPE